MTDKITADQVIDWLLENRSDAESILEQTLIAKGWTTPAEKEPEFKEGDYVLVKKDGDDQKYLGKYHFRDGNGDYSIQDSSIYFNECRYAESWLKPESGPMPFNTSGTVYKGPDLELYADDDSQRFWLVRGGKWYWLPLD